MFYNQTTLEVDAEIILNGWKISGIDHILEMGSSALPSSNLFQDVTPLPVSVSNDDTRGVSDSVDVLSEVKEGFVKLIVDNEDLKHDEKSYENEEDDEYICNVFNIIIDNE